MPANILGFRELKMTYMSGSTPTNKNRVDCRKEFMSSLNLQYPNLKRLHHDPAVFEIDDFLEESVCKTYVEMTQTHGKRTNSGTFSPYANVQRTSTTWYMKNSDVSEFIQCAVSLTGKSALTFEEPQIVRYEMGQQFGWH